MRKTFTAWAIPGTLILSTSSILPAHPGHAPLNFKPPAHVNLPAHGESIPFDLFRGQRIYVAARINGAPIDMLIDSAAQPTLMDKAMADKLGIKGSDPVSVRGVGGTEIVTVAHGVHLSVGSLQADDVDVVIMDMSQGERAIGRPTPLVIGKDLLDLAAVTFDFEKRRLTFSDPDRFVPPADAREIVLTSEQHVRSAPVSIDGGPPIAAQVDLGNPGTLLVSNAYLKQRSDLAALRSADWQIGGVGGVKAARRVTIPHIEFAGQRFTDVPAILNEDADALPLQGANIGLELLRHFVVTLEYGKDRMYLQPASVAADFHRDRAGAQLLLVGDRMKVAFVSSQSPAAGAGLKAGDELIAINSQRVGPTFYRSAAARWNEAEPGTAVKLTKADGSDVRFKLADYY